MPNTLPSTIEPSYQGAHKASAARVRRNTFGDGYSQRSADGINTIDEKWSLSWTGTTTQITELEDFFIAEGGVNSFYWTPKRESTQLLWTCNTWNRVYNSNGVDTITATLQREYDLI